ncbi:MAG: DUF6398 domain-containing protein [Methanobrevibacter sp.]|jgi:hypothetical protein|nr:DUF6398 domain-containing protein [Methanobrevibacter sp.]
MASKEEIKLKEEKLLELVGDFCDKYLDKEYSYLTKQMVKKLGRKREVPFKRGKLEIWAAAIIYAVGQINFLFDKSFQPYSSADEICNYFKTKKSTVSNKAADIRKILKLNHFDKEFSTRYMMESNPLNDLIEVNGFIVPKSLL